VGTAVDMSGVTRAKAVPLDRLEAFVRNGMLASPSCNVFCIDFGIAFTPELGVLGDLRLRLDPARLSVVNDGVAWGPVAMREQDGGPFSGCADAAGAGRGAGPGGAARAVDRRRAQFNRRAAPTPNSPTPRCSAWS